MDLLRKILSKNITLIDYECIVEDQEELLVDKNKEKDTKKSSTAPPPTKKKKKRMVAFGKYAGMAGMMDCFQPLGRRLLWKTTTTNNGGGFGGSLDSSGHPTSSDNDGSSSIGGGYSTPFLNCPPAILHCNLDEMKRSVKLLSERIQKDGLPYDESGMGEPLVFTMTGKGGNVYNGVREIFDILPHEIISSTDLPQLFHEYSNSSGDNNHTTNVSSSNNKVYGVALDIDDIYQMKKKELDDDDGGGNMVVPSSFDRNHFYSNPSEYYSTFAKTVLPYTSVLVNCIYWDPRFPRLITKQDMKELYQNGNER